MASSRSSSGLDVLLDVVGGCWCLCERAEAYFWRSSGRFVRLETGRMGMYGMSVRGRREAWRWVKARVDLMSVFVEMVWSEALALVLAGEERRKTITRS